MPRMRKGDEVIEANSPYRIKSLEAQGFKLDADIEKKTEKVEVEDESPEPVKVKVRQK